MNKLYEKSDILGTKDKTESVVVTKEGEAKSAGLVTKLFRK